MNKSLLLVVLIAFGAQTAFALYQVGSVQELLLVHLRHAAGWQIFLDLVITMVLLLVFIQRDAEATGRRFWPWAVLSLLVGSFGPLLYFLLAKEKA
ncbi:DUF2834 domain-containing protein [Rhodoferax sp.]|jgi:hypothetical protein|uniref:DUF2834 domain-containing protein n=1 Tax=Rhodoferax sp. TaxID=50421 RepID=UPI003782F244